MDPKERPLSAAERQQLREIRQRRANRYARRELQNEADKQELNNILVGIVWFAVLVWPWILFGTHGHAWGWAVFGGVWDFFIGCAILGIYLQKRDEKKGMAAAKHADQVPPLRDEDEVQVKWQAAYEKFQERQRHDGGGLFPLFKPKDPNA